MARGVRKGLKRGWCRRGRLAVAVAIAGAASAGSALAAGSPAAPGQIRIGTGPSAAASRVVGAVSGSAPMHVTIVLKPRNSRALAAYAREVSTPGSSVYHAFLTTSQFAARFGASARTLHEVRASMRYHGLLVGAVTPNRLSIPVAGDAGQIERAFAISLRRVVTPGGQRAVQASAAPALDRAIAGDVEAVMGLTSAPVPRPLLSRPSAVNRSRHRASRPTPGVRTASDAGPACPGAAGAAASDGAYTADQVASMYGFGGLYSTGAEGQRVTVAIYELESYDPSDIAAYQSCYGTGASITNVPVDGGPTGPAKGAGEAALDIEQVVGLAPRATILVYEGPNSANDGPGNGPYDTLSRIITDDRARVISMSWGQCEQAHSGGASVLDAEDTLFQEAATQGQSVVSATGDQGSEDCSGGGLAVDDPGSQPFVTGVGGTSIESGSFRPGETVWNRSNPSNPGEGGAGGGGVSSAWQMPGYQLNSAKALQVLGPYSSGAACAHAGGYCREVPDVAANADPNTGYVMFWTGNGPGQGTPGWQAVGGTSAAAPLWAALLADADSSSACDGTAIGFANPVLYQSAAANYDNYFNDITTGNNDFTGTNGGLYPAGPRYDLASGLGSPNAGALGPALCAGALHVNDPGSQVSTVGQRVSLKVTTSALPGAHLHFYATHLPPGLSISATTGRITGRPKRIGTWRSGVAALGQNLSLRGAFFNWHVGGAPTVSQTSLSGVAAGDPQLSFTLTAGRAAARLKQIAIRLFGGLSVARVSGRVSVTFFGAKRVGFTARRVGGRLQVVFAKPVRRIRVTIRSGALRATPGLASAVRRGHPPLLALAVMTTDSARHGVAAHAHVRPQS